PSNGSTIRRLASLPAVRVVPFPRFPGTVKALRLPAAPPAALRCLRLAVPLGASWFSLLPPKTQRRWTGSFGIGHPLDRRIRWRRQDLPSSWETPIASVPCSSTPADRHAPYHDGAATRPPLEERRRRLHGNFRSSITRPQSSLSTLRRRDCSPPRKTRFQVR